ncbi:MAG TPA: class II fructose-bisphosphate aldolase [Anaerovoracaceae bacterium]|nr:class II fructose-bisphosphate aldolase [Anaerovoracaceae bacterium]
MNNHHTFLHEAEQKGYAIPAFNYSDIWELLGITEAAMEEHARIYIASNMGVVDALGLEYCSTMGQVAYRMSGGNILNHLDHSTSVDLCLAAVESGYMSVMIDGSAEPLEKNIEKVKSVVEFAHKKGVLVEAEIGRIKGAGEEGVFKSGQYLAEVDDAIELIRETGVDSLAVGIGNAHGFYKEKPNINIQRLREIDQMVEVPLVLHGSTGIPFETIRQCIQNGVAKVNVGTQLHGGYLDQLRTELEKQKNVFSIPNIFEPVKNEVKKIVKEWIAVCGADGRY